MKVRNDFVSNSSSCSFIISDPAKAARIFSTAFNNIDIPYECEDKIEIYISAINRYFKQIEEDLTGQSTYEDSYVDYRDGSVKKKDLDSCGWDRIRITLPQLADANEHMNSYAHAESIKFECEDYDSTAVSLLNQFYEFFKRNGCNPDATDSEMEFLTDPDHEFFKQLATYKAGSDSMSS